MMAAGERQVSPTLDGIRHDHVARYEWAAKRIKAGSKVIDFACGIGYGSRILADAGNTVRGYDIDAEALCYGDTHYPATGVILAQADGAAPGDLPPSDVAVCFETIEHIEDPRPLLNSLHAAAQILVASVPNEDVMPWQIDANTVTAFHYRHYTRAQFATLLAESGWQVVEWHGQEGPESDVEPKINGRTLIAVCQRADDGLMQSAPPGVVSQPPAATATATATATEKHVAILGLGPSLDQYLELTKRMGGRHKFCDETWAINALGDVFACDLVFHMDDVRIQEIRAAAAPESNIAALVAWIKTSPVPVVTSRTHPDYPALVEFPLEDVLNHLGHDYFNSTAAYAVAFAIHTGATKISLFGIDYTYPNVHDAEKGRACVEFWLGQAHARGVHINLPKTTTLMDSMYPQTSRLYGYDTLDIAFNLQPDGELKLVMTERATLPTAAEIEKLYDHSAPIHEQHLGTKG